MYDKKSAKLSQICESIVTKFQPEYIHVLLTNIWGFMDIMIFKNSNVATNTVLTEGKILLHILFS